MTRLGILTYLWPYRRRVAAATLAILLTSAAVLSMGMALRFLVDEGLSKGNAGLLNLAFAGLIGVLICLSLATYARFYLVSWISERVAADLRHDLYRKLVQMEVAFFERARVGDLVSRLTTDTTLLQTVIGGAVSTAIRHALLLCGGMTLLVATSARLTGYVLLLIPVVVAPMVLLGRRVRALARDAQDRIGEVSAQAEESLAAIRTVQALTLEPYEMERFSVRVDKAQEAAMRRVRQRSLLTALVIALVFGAVLTVLWLGGHDVLAGRISPGELSAFVFYSVIVAGAVGAISEVVSDLQRAAGAADRLTEMLNLTPQIHEAPDARPGRPAEGRVTFEAVRFAYPAAPDKPVIDDMNVEIAPGQTVAIVGPSGAGKTTLFQLMLRFYDPQGGRILLDGEDIRARPLSDLRRQFGLVPQDPVLFSDTLRANIVLGDARASEADFERAAAAACVTEFARALPQEFDTHVGEKGVQLSGGQRQRIAIARAVLRDPRILLLDEATSALDSENEHQIQQALDRVKQGRTTLIIAHRLSTVMKADRILLLEEGRIMAQGTHAELLAGNPHYARLAQLQWGNSA